MIEKKTGTKVVQMITGNLNSDGVKKLSKLYREIIENKIPKEKQDLKTESWTNAERSYASQLLTRLMGHSRMLDEHEWRFEQLKFLFTYGLCETVKVGMELAPQFKDSFYRALDHKLPKLAGLRNVLSLLVHDINENLISANIKLKTTLSNEALEAWKKVIELINKLEENSKNSDAIPIFHTMILHMGLQLFSDQEMAIMSINELQSCYERLIKKSKKSKKSIAKNEQEEPEWVEVVVDLLLSLLSRNSHLLRSLVGCVFPHICPHLTSNAVSQILAVLDVNNQDNPLTTSNDSDNENDSDDSNVESDADSATENENEEEETSEMSDSDPEETFDEEDTVTDKLRLAVRQALGDASIQTDDEDIDVDEIDEEEGKRLNESLAAAFKIFRENRQSKPKKQEKSAQALTHFRVRVMDLLDDYLESEPPMAIVIDMLVPLFTLLEFCIKDPHQKPLENRVRSCLKRLSTVKKFKNYDDVNDELLTNVLKVLMEKGERSASICQEMSDKLAECCTFLVRCTQQANLSSQILIDIYTENLKAFFRKRDCILPATLFKSVLQLCWNGNWQLALMLADFAFDDTIRSFRRSQALEFLTIFYRNNRLIRLNMEHADTRMKIEKKLCKNSIRIFEELCDTCSQENGQTNNENNSNAGKEVRQKFLCLLLTLLHTVHSQHLPQAWNWQDVGKVLTMYRTNASLSKDAKTACNRLGAQLGISFDVSTKKNKSEVASKVSDRVPEEQNESVLQNGNNTDDETEAVTSKKQNKKRKKNKSKQADKLKLKKESKELRLKAVSEGLEPINFSSVSLNGTEEESQVEDSPAKQKDGNNKHKRMLTDSADIASKPKRKKTTETA